MLEVQNIPQKGRGLIASTTIPQGTLIEVAPASSFSKQQWELMQPTDIFKYCFVQASEYQANTEVDGYIVFGLVSLCNHSNTPTACIKWVKDEVGWWVHLSALRDIQIGEEVTTFYTNIDQYDAAHQFA